VRSCAPVTRGRISKHVAGETLNKNLSLCFDHSVLLRDLLRDRLRERVRVDVRVRVVVDVRVRVVVDAPPAREPVLVPVLKVVRCAAVALPETVGVRVLVGADEREAAAVVLLLGMPVGALLPDPLDEPVWLPVLVWLLEPVPDALDDRVSETVALDVPVGLADGGGSLAAGLWLSARVVCEGSTLLRDPAALALGAPVWLRVLAAELVAVGDAGRLGLA
jgi:hypothetical protein